MQFAVTVLIEGASGVLESLLWTTDGPRRLEVGQADTPTCTWGLRVVDVRQNNTQKVRQD